jgi:hypothetical protein
LQIIEVMPEKKSLHIIPIVFIVILLMAMIFGAIIVRQRAFLYGYNPRQDYNYQFNPRFVKTIPVEMKGNHLNLQQWHGEYNTAFLEITIHSTLKGFFSEPGVMMISGKDTVFQNFECRTKGIRYLNISQFVQKGAADIEFKFFGCKPNKTPVKMMAFRNEDPAKARILILAPHPDDAEIAAYGLYATNSKNCFIATVTAGDAGSMKYDELYSDSITQYVEKGKLRVWNSITVPLLAGIAPEKALNLGYFDASLKLMNQDTTKHGFSLYIKTDDINLFRSDNCKNLDRLSPPSSDWRSLVNDMKCLLLKVHPTVVVSAYPALDWHFDHKFTAIAFLQAMKELRYDSCQLWLYTNHLPLTEMYPDGKQGSAITLPPCFTNNQILFDKICSFPLSKTLQADKVIALDAMNDLRPDTQYRNTRASWVQFKDNFFNKLYYKENDYFRRSVRSNEFFFVFEPEDLAKPDMINRIVGKI